MIKSLLREPLFHFLILGGALFVFWAWNNPDESGPKPDKPRIVITESRIDSLIDIWTKTRQRPPTQQELRGLIDDYLREEIFYREALAMGLDEDDTIVRRRLRQKMELFVEDFASAAPPSVKELEEFLQSHANQFRVDRKVALRQIYLNPDKHADTLEQDVQELLAELDANSNPGQYGDSFLLPVVFELTPVRQLTQMFGGEFGQNVYAQETGTWSGPITSGYGVHLVFVEEKEEGRLPPLEEIRPVVEREWFAQKRSEAKRQFFEKLRERYEIIIELPEEDPQAAETSS
jgi:hypothetical protein